MTLVTLTLFYTTHGRKGKTAKYYSGEIQFFAYLPKFCHESKLHPAPTTGSPPPLCMAAFGKEL
jgi:hypothetical protein